MKPKNSPNRDSIQGATMESSVGSKGNLPQNGEEEPPSGPRSTPMREPLGRNVNEDRKEPPDEPTSTWTRKNGTPARECEIIPCEYCEGCSPLTYGNWAIRETRPTIDPAFCRLKDKDYLLATADEPTTTPVTLGETSREQLNQGSADDYPSPPKENHPEEGHLEENHMEEGHLEESHPGREPPKEKPPKGRPPGGEPPGGKPSKRPLGGEPLRPPKGRPPGGEPPGGL